MVTPLYRRARGIWDSLTRDEISTSASSFAYHMIFAIPPLIILSVTIATLLARVTSIDVTAHLQDQIRQHAPASTKQLLLSLVDQALVRVSNGRASIGVIVTTIVALWSGSNAVGALMRAFNTAYGVKETRSFVQRLRLKTVLTLLILLSINVSFSAIVFGKRIGRSLANAFELGSRFDRFWELATWPIATGAIALLLAALYYAGPNVDLSFRWISPGSVLATAVWLGVTALFGLYLRVFNTGSAYGALGSVVVLLFFFYVTGMTFLVGAKINAEIGKRFDPLTIEDLATSAKTDPLLRRSARRRLRRWLSRSAVRTPISPAPDSVPDAEASEQAGDR